MYALRIKINSKPIQNQIESEVMERLNILENEVFGLKNEVADRKRRSEILDVNQKNLENSLAALKIKFDTESDARNKKDLELEANHKKLEKEVFDRVNKAFQCECEANQNNLLKKVDELNNKIFELETNQKKSPGIR